MTTPEEILAFWFTTSFDADAATLRAQIERWFAGGTDNEIRTRFAEVTEEAAQGGLEAWGTTPRGRLALVLVLDQFSRSLYRDTPRAYAQDPRAQRLALEAVERGWHRELDPWEATFLAVALGHSEGLALHDRAIAALDELTSRVPSALAPLWQHSLGQARAHRDVIRRFGRHPHRNTILGRASTPDEVEYLRSEIPPHRRQIVV